MEGKIEEKIELYCRIYEQIYQRVSKSNMEKAGEVALKIFDEVTRDLKDGTVQKSGENIQPNEKEEKLATKKQREALHKFGVKKIPENLSIGEASEILNRLINFSRYNDKAAIERAVEELNRDWV